MTLQTEFNQYYDERRTYACRYAIGYFRDFAMRGQAVDTAMDLLEDYIMQSNSLPSMAYANTIIRNSIKKSSEERIVEATSQQFRGDKVYQKINKNKPLKARIENISGKSERKIMKLYVSGMSQDEIRVELGMTKQYISNVVAKWTT